MATEYQDTIGCLPRSDEIRWSWGALTPLPTQRAQWDLFAGRAHYTTGLVYPPPVRTVEVGRDGEEREPPNSRRQAEMYFLPPTHTLTIHDPELAEVDADEARKGLAGFATYLLGFLLGYRTQFEDWKVYDPAQANDHACAWFAPGDAVPRCMDAVLPTWKAAGARERRILVNLLFQYGRMPTLTFTWDQFSLTYSVTDACFKILQCRGIHPPEDKRKHKDRLEFMAEQFRIPKDQGTVTRLVGLRNQLVHELGWDSHMLGHGYPEDYPEPHQVLSAFVDRLVLGVLGIRDPFVRSEWSGVGAVSRHLLRGRDG